MELLIALLLFLFYPLKIDCALTNKIPIKLDLIANSTIYQIEIGSTIFEVTERGKEDYTTNLTGEYKMGGYPLDIIKITVGNKDIHRPIALAGKIYVGTSVFNTDERWSIDSTRKTNILKEEIYIYDKDVSNSSTFSIGFKDPWSSEYVFSFQIPEQTYCSAVDKKDIQYMYNDTEIILDIEKYIFSATVVQIKIMNEINKGKLYVSGNPAIFINKTNITTPNSLHFKANGSGTQEIEYQIVGSTETCIYTIKICHISCSECVGDFNKTATEYYDHECTQCAGDNLRFYQKDKPYIKGDIPVFNCISPPATTDPKVLDNIYHNKLMDMYLLCPENCKTCTEEVETTFQCITCDSESGYYPIEKKIITLRTLQDPPKSTDSYECYSKKTIKTLKSAYYLELEKWLPCDELCAHCIGPPTFEKDGTTPTTNCKSCITDYGIYRDQNTESNCISSKDKLKYYLNVIEDLQIYELCSTNCSTCIDGNATSCLSCIPDYFKLETDQTCQINNLTKHYLDGSILKPCYKKCSSCTKGGDDDNNNCMTCIEGMAFIANHTGQCVDIKTPNPYDTFWLNELKNMYDDCFSSCLTCETLGTSTGHQCTSCPEGYGLVKTQRGRCVLTDTKIPEYFFYNETQCFYKCFIRCNGCKEEGEKATQFCLKCRDGYSGVEINNYTNCLDMKPIKLGRLIDDIQALIPENKTILPNATFVERKYKYVFYSYQNRDKYTLDIPYFDLSNTKGLPVSSSDIYIGQNFYNSSEKISTQTNFSLYKPDGEIIKKEDLKAINASYSAIFPIYASEEAIKYQLALSLAENDIDFYNPRDPFFSVLCYPYSIDSRDLTLKDRKDSVISNLTFCPPGCMYDKLDHEHYRVHCTCFFDESIDDPLQYENIVDPTDNYPLFYCISLIQNINFTSPLMISAMVFGGCEIFMIIGIMITYRRHLTSKLAYNTPPISDPNLQENPENNSPLNNNNPSQVIPMLDNNNDNQPKENENNPEAPANPPKKDDKKVLQCRYSKPQFTSSNKQDNSPGSIVLNDEDSVKEENKQLGTIHSIQEDDLIEEEEKEKEKDQEIDQSNSDLDDDEDIVMPNSNITDLLKVNNIPEENKEEETENNQEEVKGREDIKDNNKREDIKKEAIKEIIKEEKDSMEDIDKEDLVKDDLIKEDAVIENGNEVKKEKNEDNKDNNDNNNNKENKLERQENKNKTITTCISLKSSSGQDISQKSGSNFFVPKRTDSLIDNNQSTSKLDKESKVTDLFDQDKKSSNSILLDNSRIVKGEDLLVNENLGEYDDENFHEFGLKYISHKEFRTVKRRPDKNYLKKKKRQADGDDEEDEDEDDRVLNDKFVKMLKNAANLSFSFDYVKKNDDRRFLQFFWDIYQEKQIIFSLIKNTFLFYTFSLRMFVFIFNVITIFFFNSLFHTPILISDRYKAGDSGSFFYVFTNEYNQYLLSAFCVIITSKVYFPISFIDTSFITSSDNDKEKTKPEYLERFICRSKMTIIVLILLLFGLMCGFYYYILIFYALYPNNLMPVIWASILSIILNFILQLGICLFVGFLRFIGIDNNIKFVFIISVVIFLVL